MCDRFYYSGLCHIRHVAKAIGVKVKSNKYIYTAVTAQRKKLP